MPSKLYDKLYREAQVKLAGLLEGEERDIIKIYGTALSEIRTRLDGLYKKYARDGKLSNGEFGKYNRLLEEQDQIQDILERSMKKVDSLTLRLTKEQYQASFYRHAYAIDQAGGMALEWGQIPEAAVEAAVKSSYSKLASSKAMKLSRSGTVDKVRQEISLATIRGDSYPVLANRISDALGVRVIGKKVSYIDKGAAARSLMVARTEGQRVLVDGQMEASRKASELGCDIETVWDATLDGRTRPAHGALDGKPKDDPEKGWNVPGVGWVSAPLHSGIAGFDINCRCRLRDQVKGFPPDKRYVRGDGIQPYQTYSEWKKSVTDAIEKENRMELTASNGLQINKLANHALDRIKERSISKEDIISTLKAPLDISKIKVDGKGRKSQRFIGVKATVTANPDTGIVSTAWPTHTKTVQKLREGKKG